MTLDRDALASGDDDELDRLRLALLHERSRAELAEAALAALRAEHGGIPDEATPRAGRGRSGGRFRRRR